MEKLLIKNGLIVTKDAENKILQNGIIYIEGNTIKAVERADRFDFNQVYSDTRIIDASERIVMPGFISLHSHL